MGELTFIGTAVSAKSSVGESVILLQGPSDARCGVCPRKGPLN